MALGLAREGHPVVAVGHIESDVAEMSAEAEKLQVSRHFHPLAADLRDAGECDRVVAATRERFGKVDILVNSAGLTFTYIDPARAATACNAFGRSMTRSSTTSSSPITSPPTASRAAWRQRWSRRGGAASST
jgi:NAD(P)-dependent dehydrogenase (short-subunit alcohol dehydrogenase family)